MRFTPDEKRKDIVAVLLAMSFPVKVISLDPGETSLYSGNEQLTWVCVKLQTGYDSSHESVIMKENINKDIKCTMHYSLPLSILELEQLMCTKDKG